MADNEVNAKLNVDTDEAVDDVDKLGDAFDEAAESAEDAEDKVESFGDRMDRIGGKLKGVGTALSIGVTAPIVGLAGAAINMGLEAVEAESLFETSFENMADQARAWSMETSDALGLNEFELRRQSATLFTMTDSMGLSKDAAFDMAKGITVLAGDMASFFNTSPEEAFNKLRSGITGEAEPLKQLGILVTENFIKQTDFAKAILATGRQMTEQEKVMARYHAILDQTSTAQGDLARTAESPANRIRRMSESITEATTKLGLALMPAVERILPLFEKMVGVLESAIDKFSKLPGPIQDIAIVLVGLVAAAGPVLVVVGQLVIAWGAVSTAWAASGIAAAGFTGVLTTLGAFITGTLLPLLAAVAVGIALGGAVGIAISEFLEWLGVIESVEEKTRKLVEAMGPSEQDIKLMADASVIAGREITDWGEAMEITNANIEKLRGGGEGYVDVAGKMAAETDAATQAAAELAEQEAATAAATAAAAEASKLATAAREREAKQAKALADQLGTAGMVASMEAMSRAMEVLNARGEELSTKGLDRVLKKMTELRAEGIELTGELGVMAQKFEEFGAKADEAIANMDFETPAIGIDEVGESLDAVTKEFGDASDAAMGLGTNGEAAVGGLTQSTFDLDSAMGEVNDILSETRGMISILGIDGDSALGKITLQATAIFDQFNGILGIADKVLGFFNKITGSSVGGGGGIAGMLGGLFGGGGGGGGSVAGAVGGGGGVAGGVAGVGGAGGGLFSGIGGALGGIFGKLGGLAGAAFSNPFGIAVLAGIGGFFALKGVIGGLFGGRSAETVGEEAGRDLGISISDSLAQTIHDEGKNIQLFLPEIFSEGNLGLDRLAEEVGDIFSVFEQGKISEPEALLALKQSVPLLLENFDQLGETGQFQIERIIAASERFGFEFEGLDQLVEKFNGNLKNSADSAEGIGENIAELPAVAEDAVNGVGAAFEEGTAAITEGLDPIADKMTDEILAAGEQTSAAIDESFANTNQAIQDGLGSVSDTFVSKVAPAALAAANATERIAEAARRAAEEASKIEFPTDGGGGGRGGGDGMSAAAGYRGVLAADTLIQAHRGEFVNILSPAETRTMDFAHAQNGMGPRGSMGAVFNMGDTNLSFQASGNRREDESTLTKLLQELVARDGQKRRELQRVLGVRP